jgi:hypothetical protein
MQFPSSGRRRFHPLVLARRRSCSSASAERLGATDSAGGEGGAGMLHRYVLELTCITWYVVCSTDWDKRAWADCGVMTDLSQMIWYCGYA